MTTHARVAVRVVASALIAVSLSGVLAAATVSDAIGVNIHFIDPLPGEMDELVASGVGWVRSDIGWKETEKTPGHYDFSAFDRLHAVLEEKHLRIIHMLAYGNPLYDDGHPPHSPAARAAFAAWAAAAVAHYAGHGVLWELWNEPNGPDFWPPASDVAAYAALAQAATEAIHAQTPQEQIVGPAVSMIDTDFLQGVFSTGILNRWSGVTVHPYREPRAPETAVDDFRTVRTLIRQWAPLGAHIPVLSGEWGYADSWAGYDMDRQARYVSRMFLSNISAGIPLSIWYDWRDDGTGPTNAECHFGLVHWQHLPHATQPFVPKPAYRAVATLTRELGACTFSKALAGAPGDHLLLFLQGTHPHLAVWTERDTPHTVTVPMGAGPVRVVTASGGESTMTATTDGVTIPLTGDITYLTPPAGDALLLIAAAWQAVPQDWIVPAGVASEVTLHLQNPLDRPIRVRPAAGTPGGLLPPGGDLLWQASVTPAYDGTPTRCDLVCAVEGLGTLTQQGVAVAANPLRIVSSMTADGVVVRLEDLSAQGVTGTLSSQPGTRSTVVIAPGARRLDQVVCPPGLGPWTTEVTDRTGASALDRHLDLLPLAPDHWLAAPDGDAHASGEASVQPVAGVLANLPALACTWHKAAGWRFFRIAPVAGQIPLTGHPEAITMWVRIAGSVPSLCLRFHDATGQVFQPIPHRWDDTADGWHRILFSLTGLNTYHWGGPNDGIVHQPIQLDTLLSVDNGPGSGSGTVELQAPMLTH